MTIPRAAFFASIALLGVAGAPRSTSAQAPPQQSAIELDVSSIKRTPDDVVGPQFRPYGEGMSARGINVMMMLAIVHNVQPFQVVGAPDWLVNERYDVIATPKTPSQITTARLPDLLRGVLAERFALATHREKREGATWSLDIAPPGAKLVPAAGMRPSMASASTGYLSGTMTLTTLSAWLSWRLERTVVNRTGLTDSFDIELIWQPDAGQASGTRLPAPMPPPPPPPQSGGTALPMLPMRTPPAPDPSAPSIFTAIQEQLGLKLNSVRGEIDVLVVDAISRPTID